MLPLVAYSAPLAHGAPLADAQATIALRLPTSLGMMDGPATSLVIPHWVVVSNWFKASHSGTHWHICTLAIFRVCVCGCGGILNLTTGVGGTYFFKPEDDVRNHASFLGENGCFLSFCQEYP